MNNKISVSDEIYSQLNSGKQNLTMYASSLSHFLQINDCIRSEKSEVESLSVASLNRMIKIRHRIIHIT